MSGARVLLAVPLGGIVAFVLFYFMQALIASSERADQKEYKNVSIDIVRAKRDEDIRTKDRKLPDKPQEQKPPPPPQLEQIDTAKPGMGGIAMNIPNLNPDLNVQGGMGFNVGDGDVLPLVRVNPIYPARALQRGVEGWCQLEFDVTPAGTVENARVVNCDPAGMFDRASLNAVQRFKYKPKIVDGQPVYQRGIKFMFTYKIEK